MYLLNDVPLQAYSTMRLGGQAKHLTEVSDRSEIAAAFKWAKQQNLPVIMIGGGSNIIWQDSGFPGLVIVNKIIGYETFDEDEDNRYVTAGAGETWDSVVERTVSDGYTGIEQLSLIPGTAGATPIQNVGAYGREIADVLVCVQAYDSQTDQLVTIPAADCAFGYRTSRFKAADKGRFFIWSITLHVMRGKPQPPYYPALQAYFEQHNITDVTAKTMRDAVVAVRSGKLPDPALVANNGSFFANPVISPMQFTQMEADFPDIAHWILPNDMVKLSAGWLVEQAGFKGFHDPETGMATWDKQALVLVNEHATSTASLLKFEQKILDAVEQKFGIKLEQEPELIA